MLLTWRKFSRTAARWLTFAVLLAYVGQYFYSQRAKGHSTGLGVAILHLAAPSLRAANNPNGPQMNLGRVYGGPEQCSWLNFEQLWGRCVTAYVDVLDEDNLDLPAVNARAEQLLELVAKPCAPSARASNEMKAMIRCDTVSGPYRVKVVVMLVRAGPGGLANTSDLFAWNRVVIREILVISSKGEIL